MNITFDKSPFISGNMLSHEHVERKGIGHPDTICDQIAEKASEIYSRYAYEKYGKIPHHWFDKVILVGGESSIDFGRGELVQPYTIIFTGKVCFAVGDEPLPVYELLQSATKLVLERCLIGFDASKHVKYEFKLVDYHGAGRNASRYRPQSVDDLGVLEDVCNSYSNDCNLVSGYAPLSDLETMTFEGEGLLNSLEFRAKNPEIGSDIKVFAVRNNNDVELIFNIPFLGEKVASRAAYDNFKDKIFKILVEKYQKDFASRNISIVINPQDRTQNPYLTAIGSAADTGDVGLVGRGNRINGLITPMRPMSIEAPAGKNPIDHTGKILGFFAREVAHELYLKFKTGFYINIFIAKGSRLNLPDAILISMENPEVVDQDEVQRFVQERLDNLSSYCSKFVFEGAILW